MTEYTSGFSVANAVRQKRSLHKGSFLIVEGERDFKLLTNFISIDNCRLEIARGKLNVIDGISILNKSIFDGALGVVDADFSRIENPVPNHSNLLSTDYHDLEVEMIVSSALERVLSEYGDPNKVTQLSRTMGSSVRDILFDSGYIIGSLRLFSQRQDIRLNFKGLDFKQFIGGGTLSVDRHSLVKAVLKNTYHPSCTSKALLSGIDSVIQEGHKREHMCSGHDLVSLLAFGLNSVFGNFVSHRFDEPFVASCLRMSYPSESFWKTKLFAEMRKWEQRNSTYKLMD